MSLHPPRRYTPAEVLAATSRPVSPAVRTAVLASLVIGLVVFVIGWFVAPQRVWLAFPSNWLFFTSLSSAGVTFVAVQRITTARWSRAVVRFLEAYVAFLPFAFVDLLLILTVGRKYIFPWTHEAYPVAEKATYFNPTFLTIRDIGVFGLITALSLYYVYT